MEERERKKGLCVVVDDKGGEGVWMGRRKYVGK